MINFENDKNSLFKLLSTKSIIEILNGDYDFGTEVFPSCPHAIELSMPKLTGTDIVDISNRFGLATIYTYRGGNKSRWNYMQDLINHCIKHDSISDLLSFLFSVEQFYGKLKDCSASDIEKAHKIIVEKVLEKINGFLFFSKNTIQKTGNNFTINPIGSSVPISIPTVKKIDREYIKDLNDKALKDIEESNYDSAITKSRTILEEAFCYAIEKKGEVPYSSGNINKLYNQVKSIYKMHQDKNTDKRINMLLSGLEKVVTAVTEMRNEMSDSHGLGSRRINIMKHHTLLVINSATTMANFILDVCEISNISLTNREN